jgi:hypothetical protein
MSHSPIVTLANHRFLNARSPFTSLHQPALSSHTRIVIVPMPCAVNSKSSVSSKRLSEPMIKG